MVNELEPHGSSAIDLTISGPDKLVLSPANVGLASLSKILTSQRQALKLHLWVAFAVIVSVSIVDQRFEGLMTTGVDKPGAGNSECRDSIDPNNDACKKANLNRSPK